MGENLLQAWCMPFEQSVSRGIMMVQHANKMKQVCCVESPVFEGQQAFQVIVLVVYDKLIWRLIHQCHQFIAFVDDGGAVAPGKNSSKKSSNFDVGFLAETVGDGNWILLNEPLMVVPLQFLVKERLYSQ